MTEFTVKLGTRISTIVRADAVDLVERKDGSFKFYSGGKLQAECPTGPISFRLDPGESTPTFRTIPDDDRIARRMIETFMGAQTPAKDIATRPAKPEKWQ